MGCNRISFILFYFSGPFKCRIGVPLEQGLEWCILLSLSLSLHWQERLWNGAVYVLGCSSSAGQDMAEEILGLWKNSKLAWARFWFKRRCCIRDCNEWTLLIDLLRHFKWWKAAPRSLPDILFIFGICHSCRGSISLPLIPGITNQVSFSGLGEIRVRNEHVNKILNNFTSLCDVYLNRIQHLKLFLVANKGFPYFQKISLFELPPWIYLEVVWTLNLHVLQWILRENEYNAVKGSRWSIKLFVWCKMEIVAKHIIPLNNNLKYLSFMTLCPLPYLPSIQEGFYWIEIF